MTTKHCFLLIIAFVFSANTFSQIEKGNILISLDGNYQKTGSSIGGLTNSISSSGPTLLLGVSAGVMCSDNWCIGLGLAYGRNKTSSVNILSYDMQHLQIESSEIKENIYMPNISVSYYFYKLLGKLYLNTTFGFSAGFAKQEGDYFIVSSTNGYGYGGYGNGYGRENLTNAWTSDMEFGNFTLYPELVYMLSNRIGLHLGLGGVSCIMPNWETKNSIWLVNFNPQYWQLGIKFKI